MLTLPTSIIQELLALASDGAVLWLLSLPEYDIYLARNTEDIEWPAGSGIIYQKFWFNIGALKNTSAGAIPDLTIEIDNVGGMVEEEVMAHNYFLGATCNIYIVNSKCLNESTPIYHVAFQVLKPTCDGKTVSVKLGIENPILMAFPSWKFHGSICQYRQFKGPLCGYSGEGEKCDRKLEACIGYGNTERIGMQLGIIGEIQDA